MPKYSEVARALEIFQKYDNDFLETDHEIMYGISIDTDLSEEDRKELEKLGWFESDEYDCWACFT